VLRRSKRRLIAQHVLLQSYPFPALRARIAQFAAEGRHAERDNAAWDLADRIAGLGDQGFNPGRRPAQSGLAAVSCHGCPMQ
jgi:hypothetical protein